jgi:TRAP-type C4-dicarboxylate transport system permease small subunit
MRPALVAGLNAVDRLRNGTLAALLGVMTAVYTLSFVSRYIPQIGSFNWAEELTRYLHVWTVLLAFGYLIRRNGHASTDVLVRLFPTRVQRASQYLADAMLGVLAVIFLYYGLELTLINLDQAAPSLSLIDIDLLSGWPTHMGWPYAAIPVGGLLALLDLVAIRLGLGESAQNALDVID